MQAFRMCVLAWAFGFVSSSDPVAAQPNEVGDTVEESAKGAAELTAGARSRYQDGVEAYRKGRYKEAIDAFIAADLLVPSAALSFNIARAYEKLQDPSNAVVWYRDFLHRSGFLPDRAAIETRISALETVLSGRNVQRLSVVSIPVGANLALDGKPIGSTPWDGQIPLGSHDLELSLSGYVPSRQTVWLTSDSAADVHVSLYPNNVDSPREMRVKEKPSPKPVAAAVVTDEKPKTSRGNGLRTLAYVAAATGTAAVAGGVVFEILRRRTESEAAGDPHQVSFAQKYDAMVGQQTASRVLLGVGAGLLVTSGTLLLVNGGSTKTHPTAVSSLSLGCGGTGCAASMSGRF